MRNGRKNRIAVAPPCCRRRVGRERLCPALIAKRNDRDRSLCYQSRSGEIIARLSHHLAIDDGLKTAVAFPAVPKMTNVPPVSMLGPFRGDYLTVAMRAGHPVARTSRGCYRRHGNILPIFDFGYCKKVKAIWRKCFTSSRTCFARQHSRRNSEMLSFRLDDGRTGVGRSAKRGAVAISRAVVFVDLKCLGPRRPEPSSGCCLLKDHKGLSEGLPAPTFVGAVDKLDDGQIEMPRPRIDRTSFNECVEMRELALTLRLYRVLKDSPMGWCAEF